VASVYDYEAEDPEVVKKVNGCLEELHEDDNKEYQVAKNYVDANVVQEQAAEVEELESRTTEKLGCMTEREHQDIMFILTK